MMNIVYACDDNFAWLTGISILSLYENNRDIQDLDVWLISDGISNKNKRLIEEMADGYGRKVTIVEKPELDLPDLSYDDRWSASTFTRLYLADILPKEIDKVLYVDGDTIVRGSIAPICETDPGDNVICGVRDCISRSYKKNIGLDEEDIYVNAGVIIMNLRELRKLDMSGVIETFVARYGRYITYPDQDLLNSVFRGRIGELPPEFNVMTIATTYSRREIEILRRPTCYYPAEILRQAADDPVIVHFTTNMLTVRPWYSNASHPFTGEFRHYMSMSPWADRKLDRMVFRKKEHKVIKAVNMLPPAVSIRLLGILHTSIRPAVTKLKAKRRA